MKREYPCNKLTIKDAFEQLISQPMWWVGILKNSSLAAYTKRHYKDGKISLQKMKEILLTAGYEVAQVELWRKK